MGQNEYGDEHGWIFFNAAIGKRIKDINLYDNVLGITFEDGYRIRIFDAGQACCERRYMRTDDDLDYFIGAKLMGAEVKNAPNIPDGDNFHEVQFFEIQTDKGVFTMSSHNEHNGYYGGFFLRVDAVEPN